MVQCHGPIFPPLQRKKQKEDPWDLISKLHVQWESLSLKTKTKQKQAPPTKKKPKPNKKNPQDGEIPKTDLWLPHTQVHMSMCIPTHSTLTNHTHLN